METNMRAPGGGSALPMVLEAIVLHAGFGLGMTIVFRFGRHLADWKAPSRRRPSPTDQEGDRLYRPLGRVRIEHEPSVVRRQHHPVPAAQGMRMASTSFRYNLFAMRSSCASS